MVFSENIPSKLTLKQAEENWSEFGLASWDFREQAITGNILRILNPWIIILVMLLNE